MGHSSSYTPPSQTEGQCEFSALSIVPTENGYLVTAVAWSDQRLFVFQALDDLVAWLRGIKLGLGPRALPEAVDGVPQELRAQRPLGSPGRG